MSIYFSYLPRQWAAVSITLGDMRDPPQKEL